MDRQLLLMVLAYHKDVPTELYVPISFALLDTASRLCAAGLFVIQSSPHRPGRS